MGASYIIPDIFPNGKRVFVFAACRQRGAFGWTCGPGEVLAETCQLVLFDPTLLICEKKRGVEPPRRSCFLRWRVNTQGSADPCAIPWVLGMRCLTTGASFYGFCQHSRSGLQLQTGLQFVQRSDCRAADLAVFRRRKAFLLCKNPCGGTAVGMGSPPQSGLAAPAQRNFQRKFALRQVGSSKFVVPPTRKRSKVRNIARLGKSLYRAAPGCQRDRGPSVSGGVQRNPFQGVPLGNFFAEARHRASFRR